MWMNQWSIIFYNPGTNLNMTKSLEQNGVKDEDEEFYELNFNEEDWLPAIHIYFNDDLTEAWTIVMLDLYIDRT